jgi:peptidoglycan lytic transglycosylase A
MRRTVLLLLVFLALPGCVTRQAAEPARFHQTGFARLPGWQDDDLAQALPAFQRSCARLSQLPPGTAIGPYGTAADWRGPCEAAQSAADARSFFETQFVPFAVRAGCDPDGLFTGYYEPELRGSLARGGAYTVPLLARPPDLISVDLGLFRPALKGQRIAGRLAAEGRLVPYADRQGIEAAAGKKDPLRTPLVWVDDAADAFFMQIQGSGRIRLADGRVIRLGYDGQNGHPYTPIGRLLIERGALEKGQAGMQAIRAWLAQNPQAGRSLMDENASYVFFKEMPIDDPALGPPGAEAVALTPGRSLAVDLASHGLGVPVFVAAASPAPGEPPFRRLMVAQDTGGAIRGAVRGDVFWGFGPEAGALAGTMAAKGRMFALIPRALAAGFAESHR